GRTRAPRRRSFWECLRRAGPLFRRNRSFGYLQSWVVSVSQEFSPRYLARRAGWERTVELESLGNHVSGQAKIATQELRQFLGTQISIQYDEMRLDAPSPFFVGSADDRRLSDRGMSEQRPLDLLR